MIVGIISPYSGDVIGNLAYLAKIFRDILADGDAPVAGHAMYPAILDDNDPEQRAKGMKAGQILLLACDQVRVYIDRGISRGMWEDLEHVAEGIGCGGPTIMLCWEMGSTILDQTGWLMLRSLRDAGVVAHFDPRPVPAQPAPNPQEPIWRKRDAESDVWNLYIGNLKVGQIYAKTGEWFVGGHGREFGPFRFDDARHTVEVAMELRPCRVEQCP